MAALVGLPLIGTKTALAQQDRLAGSGEVVIQSYGGSFTDGARKLVFEPFTKATGIKVVDVIADLGEPQVRAMHAAGKVEWDIAGIVARNFPPMRDAGMFAPIDYTLWDAESIEGSPAQTRLREACLYGQSSQVLAYDTRTFPKGGPKNWQDFWDLKKFPGTRGLNGPQANANIQFALLASGVSAKEIWPLTEDKLSRAFAKLDELKPHIAKWWNAGGEAPQLLIKQEYAMTACYDGRAISVIRQGAPVSIVWEGACLVYTYACVLKGGPNTANAQKFLAYLNRAQNAAAWTLGSGLPGSNTNQLKYLPPELVPLLSVNPENAAKTVFEDYAWLGQKRPDGKTNQEYLLERWLAWRAKA
jgi:putative spermidine/putrescine transport system substrate-binding protein/mannopine transport system substrate-binding protein